MEANDVARSQSGVRAWARTFGWARLVVGLLLVCYVAYAAVFIYQTSFVYQGERYFVLFDDPMISMQYAKNLANGHGPVWNPGGDRVEGYSNPLWVGYMALVQLLPIPLSKNSLVIQVTGLVLTVATLLVVRKLAKELAGGSELAGLLALGLTAFYYPLNVWSLEGNEVSALMLIVSVVALRGVKDLRSGRFTRWPYLLLGASTLIRMDMAAAAVAFTAFMALADRARARQHLFWGLGSAGAFLLGQTVWRYLYYGELLPNTYYLKMTGFPMVFRVTRGAYVLVKFIWNFNWVLFVLPFLYLLARRDWDAALLAALVAVQLAYSVYVGGDAWEHRGGANRFIAVAMPLFFVLFSDSLVGIKRAVLGRLLPTLRGRVSRLVEPLAALSVVVLAVVSLLNFNALLDTSSLRMMFLQGRPMFAQGSEKYMTVGLVLREVTSPQASVAVVGAGGTPYASDRAAVDLLGKSDLLIAREPARYSTHPPWLEFRPGHMKWDYDRSVGELKPDVIVEFWEGSGADAERYRGLYTPAYFPQLESFLPDGRVYFRTGSPNVEWQTLQLNPPGS